MDTFKGQDNDDFGQLCAKRNCEIVIMQLNLEFQPPDLSVSKATKA